MGKRRGEDQQAAEGGDRAAGQADVIRHLSADGLEILVGRSARDNDLLTFQLAGQNDFWFHVAPTSGSHVVVRNPDNLTRLPKATLRQAAALAVWHSKSRGGGRVAVNYTRVRFVSKRRGAPPGQVQIKQQQTVRVSADERPDADPGAE